MEKKRVLIVEDELITANSLKMQLVRWNYLVVEVVASGSKAIISAEKNYPDLILMDIFLEDNITGIEAVKKIHEKNFVPVIYITASDDPETFKKVQETEFFDIFIKPYMPDKLKSALESVFK